MKVTKFEKAVIVLLEEKMWEWLRKTLGRKAINEEHLYDIEVTKVFNGFIAEITQEAFIGVHPHRVVGLHFLSNEKEEWPAVYEAHRLSVMDDTKIFNLLYVNQATVHDHLCLQ